MSEAQPSRRQARVLKAWTRFHRWAYRRTVQYLAPWYAGYQQRASREIPHIRLPPAQSPH